jgi:hypothetical protein
VRAVTRVERQAGSAYLLALLVLAVLTGLGIALARVAQQERARATAFLARTQAMSAAESGVSVAEIRLVESDVSDPLEVVFGLQPARSLVGGNRVVIESVAPVIAVPCDLCEIGAGSRWFRVDYGLTSLGERRAWKSGTSPLDGRLMAAFAVEVTLSVEPWPLGDELLERLVGGEGSP